MRLKFLFKSVDNSSKNASCCLGDTDIAPWMPQEGSLGKLDFGVCFPVNQDADSPARFHKFVAVWFVCAVIKGSVAAAMYL